MNNTKTKNKDTQKRLLELKKLTLLLNLQFDMGQPTSETLDSLEQVTRKLKYESNL